MKKLTASIVAGALMISAMGINAFAAEATPKITVFGTESSPVKAGAEVNIDVRLSNFDTVKGMDIILKGDDKVTLTDINTDGYKKGENYTVKGNEIHIVDLNREKTVNLKVKAKATGEGKITVETAKLAKSGTALFGENEVRKFAGTIKVATEATKTAEKTTLKARGGYFIPYGSVYEYNSETGAYDWYTKAEDGTFKDVPAGTPYQEFENPSENGLTTFGSSTGVDEGNPQFGTYALNVAGKTCGTMSIIGDWNGFVDYYRNNYGRTVAELVESVSAYYEANITTGYTHVILKWTDGTNENTLKIYKKNQLNWMWKDGTNLQYALRVNGLKENETCTAVGYAVGAEGSVTFSKTVKTETKTAVKA